MTVHELYYVYDCTTLINIHGFMGVWHSDSYVFIALKVIVMLIH